MAKHWRTVRGTLVLNLKRHLAAVLANAVFCLAIAITTYLLTAHDVLSDHLAVSYCIGFSIHGAALLGLRLFPARWPPIVAAVFSLPLGLLVGLSLGGAIVTGDPLFFITREFSALVYGTLFGLIGIAAYVIHANLWATRDALEQERARLAIQQKTLAETELKLLQAQIEPHFLFNTLAAIHGSIRHRPDLAEHMLEHLTLLLRASLKRSRSNRTTVQDELDIVTAYLEIQSVRLGARLRFSIEADDGLKQALLPALLIQPLVENAAVHGIEPLACGGQISVTVKRHGDHMNIVVEDSGAGVENAPPSAGTGTGLRACSRSPKQQRNICK
ncbi:MAG: hypothetical protein GKR94_06370 [Gammaproteobacteria bacterium]|nr:hypothetical protein [Gammaproteobacteria bacterium]